jgi:hypothetical protein
MPGDKQRRSQCSSHCFIFFIAFSASCAQWQGANWHGDGGRWWHGRNMVGVAPTGRGGTSAGFGLQLTKWAPTCIGALPSVQHLVAKSIGRGSCRKGGSPGVSTEAFYG